MLNNILYDKIKLSQEGYKNYMFDVINQFSPLIKKYAYKLHYEDSEGELVLFFIELLHNIPLDKFSGENKEYCIISYINKAIINKYISLSKSYSNYIYKNVSFNNEINYKVDNDMLYDYRLETTEAISSLTELQKKVIKAKYIYGYSDAEIAKMLCVTRQSVNRTKNRAFKELRSYFNH